MTDSNPRLVVKQEPNDNLSNLSPERTYQEVGQLIDSLEDQLERINLHDLPMRKNVWQGEFDRIQSRRLTRTLIAVCGTTGAGKSSLLNAVLDDNLVPTSGMNACTSVVTEIQYHNKKTIVGEVEFLTLAEWKEELIHLFGEVKASETEKSQKISDLQSEAGAAWHKIHTVYPHLKPGDVVELGVDALLQSEQHNAISNHLGSTQTVESPDSTTFRAAMGKYIESPRPRNLRRGKTRGTAGPQPESQGAIWPLIRLVRIKARSKALSSGAVLVDLPGVADANLARGKIAKNYMQTCDHIWVVSDIIRAVDEKAARDLLGDSFRRQIMMDGNYNTDSITFIATKTDNVSCPEVIRELDLAGDPELQDIETRINAARAQEEHWMIVKSNIAEKIQAIKAQMNDQHTTLQAHPIGLIGANKRKRETEPAVRDIKRICAQPVAQNVALNAGDMDVDQVGPVKTELDDAMNLSLETESTHCPDWAATDHISDVFKQGGNQMGTLGSTLQRLEESSVEAEVKILTYKKEVAKLEKQRKSFCAIERNASSKEILQEDFRNGLEQIEVDEELEGNSDRSEPRPNQNYDTTTLSVFTCSARDYTQMTTRLDNYGETACFSDPADTEIPALQDRCHSLATRAHEQAVSSLASNLAMLLKGIEEFLRDADGIDIHDCRSVSEKWSSEVLLTEDTDGLGLAQTLPTSPSPDSTPEPRKTRSGRRLTRRSTTPLEDAFEQKVQQARILDRNQRAMQQRRTDKGFSHLLQKRMNTVASKCQKHVQSEFRNKIRSPCQAGAITAKNTATKTMEDSTQKMRWNTVKAVLRRYGEYKEVDLNTELARPMTQRITRPWSRVFEQNGLMLLHQMATASKEVILDLLKEVEGSSPPSLRARFQAQCHLAYQEAEKSIDNIVENLGVLIHREQKSISRSLVPYIKTELRDTYTEIIESSGTGAGSGNRLKQNLQDRVDHHRSHLFFDTCENMARKLDRLAEGLGVMVRVALCELSDKIEVNIATVWDTPLSSANDGANKDSVEWKEELAIRGDVSAKVRAMLSQLNTLVQPNDGAA